jgi:hypothetical protein
MENKIEFPAIYIAKNGVINVLRYRFLVCDDESMELGLAFRSCTVIDNLGRCFRVDGVRPAGSISLYHSFRYFAKLRRVEPILTEDVVQLSIEEVKDLLVDVIRKNPRANSSLAPAKEIIKDINRCITLKEIIKFL